VDHSQSSFQTQAPVNACALLAKSVRNGIGLPPRSMRQWLTDEFTVPDGPFAGQKFRFDRQPIAALWVDEIDSGRWVEHVYTGPSQSGKSLIGYVAPLLYHACELNEKLIFAVPLDEMAADKWEADIKPVMEASSRLRKLLPKRGPGSAGGTIRDRVTLYNGAVLKIMAAGGSDQSKAGYTARVLCATEIAAFSEASQKSAEGDPLRQVMARLRSATRDERRIFLEGTNATDQMLPATLKESSSQSTIIVQCLHCGEWILPTREDLHGWQEAKNEIEARDNSAWHCNKCGEGFSESDRHEMLTNAKLLHKGQTISKRGEIEGELPPTKRLYFEYNAFHNMFLTAGDIGYDCWAANQIEPETPARESAEKELCQFVFGTTYKPPLHTETDVVIADSVADRRLRMPRGIAPEDTNRLVLGADVGGKQCHWVLLAIRECGALHVVDYGISDVPVKSKSLRAAIRQCVVEIVDQFSLGVLRDGSSDRLPLSAAYIDSGFQPDAIFDAAKEVDKSVGFLSILGRGLTQMEKRRYSLPTKTGNIVREIDKAGRWHVSRVRRANVDQLTLDSDSMKLLVLSGLLLPVSSSGSISLFAGPGSIHNKISKHLCSEQLIREEIPGQPPTQRWIKSGANHYLDALAYAVTAALRLGWSPETSEEAAEPEPEESWSPD
jgi:phage terminase large subunit GpA-like protein